jgi:hypothetical protein
MLFGDQGHSTITRLSSQCFWETPVSGFLFFCYGEWDANSLAVYRIKLRFQPCTCIRLCIQSCMVINRPHAWPIQDSMQHAYHQITQKNNHASATGCGIIKHAIVWKLILWHIFTSKYYCTSQHERKNLSQLCFSLIQDLIGLCYINANINLNYGCHGN